VTFTIRKIQILELLLALLVANQAIVRTYTHTHTHTHTPTHLHTPVLYQMNRIGDDTKAARQSLNCIKNNK